MEDFEANNLFEDDSQSYNSENKSDVNTVKTFKAYGFKGADSDSGSDSDSDSDSVSVSDKIESVVK